ncbi:MAG TPA: hypothetical protein VFD70_09875 [Anaerolineae bacterium]|nr:hypothetical protein [Anaerolineae bacterium]
MDTALEIRIRAAGAEMMKPGRWRLAMEQLRQATEQILASPDVDSDTARLALEQWRLLSQWASVMQPHELRQVNHAILELDKLLSNT